MRKYVLDFVFNERTGESKIVVDFIDDSMSALETNEAIRGGELREKALEMAQTLFGPEVVNKVREGKIGIICLDHHPEKDEETPLIAVSQDATDKPDIKQ